MSCCVDIVLKQKPNTTSCTRYRLTNTGTYGLITMRRIDCNGAKVGFLLFYDNPIEVCCKPGEIPYRAYNNDTTVDGDLEIEVLGPCSTPVSYTDVPIHLDMPTTYDIRETKRVVELTDLNKLKFDFSVGADLQGTPKNYDALKHFVQAGIIDNYYKALNVDVKVGSKIFQTAELAVLNFKNNKFKTELRLSTKHWARQSADLKLRDLTYSTVTFDCAHFVDVITNQYPFSNTDLGIWYPYVNYGRILQDDTGNNGRANHWILPNEYQRPWFYVLDILRKGFCAMGYEFASPLFESPVGRSLITYIIDRHFGESNKESLNAHATVEDEYYLGSAYLNGRAGVVIFPEIQYDPSGLITGAGLNGSGEVNIKGKIKFQAAADVDITVNIGQYKGASNSLKIQHLYQSQQFVNPTDSTEFNFELKNVSLNSLENLGIIFVKSDAGVFVQIQSGSFIEIEGVRTYIGGSMNLASLIDPEYTFLNFLKGLAHNFNLKFHTHLGKVTIYQAHTTNFWGDVVEGFYLDDIIEDIGESVLECTNSANPPNKLQPRFVEYSFKPSSDKYIEKLNLTEQLWSTKEDLGEQFTNSETKPFVNPFFEPTATNNSTFTNSFAVHIPFMFDGTEHGWNYNPRIAIARGYVLQDFENVQKPQLRLCDYSNQASELIPTASQYTNIKLGTHNNQNSATEIPFANNVFKVTQPIIDTGISTLFKLVYLRWLLEQMQNLKLEYLVKLSIQAYSEIDFRKHYKFNHLGRTVIARISQIKDFHYCANVPTPVEFVPQRQASNACGLLPESTGGTICRNNPVILHTFDGSCYNFSLGGANSNVANYSFQYTLLSNILWQPVINNELCNMSEDFKVKLIVEYDECPSIAVFQNYSPCPAFEGEIECITIKVPVGTPGTTIDGLKARIQLPPGAVATNIVGLLDGQPIEVNQYGDYLWSDYTVANGSHYFDITFQLGGCPAIQLTKNCTLGTPNPTPDACTQITLAIECEDAGSNCATFVVTGLAQYDYDAHIKYRTSIDGVNWGPWLLWDNETPVCGGYIQAQLFAQFCNDNCPFYCSEIITCGDGCEFIPAVATNSSLCNNGQA